MCKNRIKIKIEGYELVQSIQLFQSTEKEHSEQYTNSEVTLLQGKDTYLRVYYSHEDDYLNDYENFTCELVIKFNNSNPELRGKKFQLLKAVAVEKSPDPKGQRFNFRKSLNFKILARFLSQTR